MKRTVLAILAAVAILNSCYMDLVEVRVTPKDVKIDYKEHQITLVTDNMGVHTCIYLYDDYSYTCIVEAEFYMKKSASVYDGKWISVVVPQGRSNGNIYVLCSENHSTQPRQCKIRVRNFEGSDVAIITQAGRPESLSVTDESLEESSQSSGSGSQNAD